MKLHLILILICSNAFAGDAHHRNTVTSLAFASAIDRPLRNTIWISGIDINAETNDLFLSSSGAPVMIAKKMISSAYDSDITHDVSRFYEKKGNRVKLMSNFTLDSPKTIYSIGFDSGISSDKIAINKSIFLGLAHVIALNPKTHMAFSAGSWFGGKTKETPCYDSYDREYWCQNLTSWADYEPSYPKNFNYLDVKVFYRF